MKRYAETRNAKKRHHGHVRKGIIAVLSALLLVVVFAFVAFAIDTAKIALKQTEMQTAVDAAALAASQELSESIAQASRGEDGDIVIDDASPAIVSAREVAADVAAHNGVFIDPDEDVQFGRRYYDEDTGEWPIEWGSAPYNVVRVQARRTNEDLSAPDGQIPLSFGWAVGKKSAELTLAASAFIEARDMVLVLDFSASMNDDSSMLSFNSLGQSNVEASLDAMWQALRDSGATFPDTGNQKFPESFGRLDSNYGRYIYSRNSNQYVFEELELDEVDDDGRPLYPFPQPGRYSNGLPRNEPDYWTSRSLWLNYINYVRRSIKSQYRHRYGFRSLMEYLQQQRYGSQQSEDLWRTPHYPFHAIKEGATQFTEFLDELDYGDELGLVSYGQYAKSETTLNDGDATVDISNDPITSNFEAVDTIQRHKQAGHDTGWTGMGYGIKEAREMLLGDDDDSSDNGHARYGARPILLIMTDGQTNQGPSNFSLPAGWDWADYTDYDGDGDADYWISNHSSYSSQKKYAFYQAVLSMQKGATINTMSVGNGADHNLMKAIAFMGGGEHIRVNGGTSIEEMTDDLESAFGLIAGQVPPAKLIYDDEAE